MNSAGGALTFQMAEAKPISTIFSGPAGGVSGALNLAKIMEKNKLLSIRKYINLCFVNVIIKVFKSYKRYKIYAKKKRT